MIKLTEYYDFDVNPFVDSVNPAFFFQTAHHEKAMLRTLYCIEDQRALGLVWGKSGTGKTLIAQMVLKKIDREKFEPVVILCTPGMTKTPLLREIVGELGVEKPPFRSQVLLDLIHQRVMKEYALGRRIVLLVDEAHFLASNSLHILRTLSNLETSAGKLLTTILFAEQNLVQRLKHPRYASLRGRISIETEIPPLSIEETEQYVKFRLLVAGGQADLFSGECYPVIYRKTRGIPREISKLADNALLEAYMEGKRIIEPETVEASLLKV